jgi:hypothetical protein
VTTAASPHPSAALRYLWARSLRNRTARRIRRLRRPRYAIGLLLGLGYLWLVLGRPGATEVFAARRVAGTGANLASLGMMLLAARWWLLGGERTALAFSPAEVDFLFPAPLTRRQLIAYKLLRSQLPIVVSAGLWTVIVGGGGGVPWALRALAAWSMLATLQMHHLGASLVRASAVEQGVAGARRNALSLALFAAAALAMTWAVVASLPALRGAAGIEVVREIGGVLRHPAAQAVLLPFRVILAPVIAPTLGEWARAIVPSLVLLAAHLVWVLGRDRAFEEAAAEESTRRAKRLAAMKERGSLAPVAGSARGRVPLPPHGPPAVAIVWKNLVAQRRAFRSAMAVRVLIGVVVGFVIGAGQAGGDLLEFLGIFVASWAGILIVAGPAWVRNDLRLDLPRLEVLRAWPLRGAAIVAAEVAASTIALTIVQLAALALGLTILALGPGLPAMTPLALAIAGAGVVALPVVNAAGMSIQNALTLLFPDLGQRGLQGAGGVELIGQNMLALFGSLILLIVALAAPAAAAVGTGAVLKARLLPPAAVAAAALAGLLVLAAELAVAIRWMGRQLERTEPGSER